MQRGRGTAIIIEEAKEIAANNVGKEQGDPSCVKHDTRVEDCKAINGARVWWIGGLTALEANRVRFLSIEEIVKVVRYVRVWIDIGHGE